MPSEGVDKIEHDQVLTFEEIIRFLRITMTAFEIRKVHLTGGEPLVRAGVIDLIKNISLLDITDLALTTNGQHLAKLAPELQKAGLTRVNISCDSLKEKTFGDITRTGTLIATLDGIEAACNCFKSVKLNTVVLKDLNDGEVADIAAYGMERGCQVRFIELMPIHCARPFFDEMFVPASETYARLAERFTLEPLPYQPGESS
ncbi:MAG: radical SAM protein, partial [Sedimentisphaerales bacterium]|nr:radical SAM protein [Sedimentisphaerales bacterium]